MSAKFKVTAGGVDYFAPNWVNAKNEPFQNAQDAEEWGGEVICQHGLTSYQVAAVDGSYRKEHWWEDCGGFEKAFSRVITP